MKWACESTHAGWKWQVRVGQRTADKMWCMSTHVSTFVITATSTHTHTHTHVNHIARVTVPTCHMYTAAHIIAGKSGSSRAMLATARPSCKWTQSNHWNENHFNTHLGNWLFKYQKIWAIHTLVSLYGKVFVKTDLLYSHKCTVTHHTHTHTDNSQTCGWSSRVSSAQWTVDSHSQACLKSWPTSLYWDQLHPRWSHRGTSCGRSVPQLSAALQSDPYCPHR